jgi:DNA processing protein
MAMRGALSAGKGVVGLMGCGIDVVYPAENRSLLLDTQRYGCLLSEFPPGTPPYKWNFPKRNRILSGLSCGVVVVEAPTRSGALITTSQAAEQGRDVFVIPGNVDVAACAGSNALLRDGAIAVSTGWDILSEYVALFPDMIRKDTTSVVQTLYPDEEAAVRASERTVSKVAQLPRLPKKRGAKTQQCDTIAIDNGAPAPYIENKDTDDPSLTGDERAVLALLKTGERLVDDVIAQSGLPSGVVLSTLTLLEVKGLIRRLPGRHVCLAGQKP